MDYNEFSTFSTDFSTGVFHNGISLWKSRKDDIIFLQWNRPKDTFWGNRHFDMAGIFVKNMGLDKGGLGQKENFQKRVDFREVFRYNTGLYEIPA